MAEQPTRLLSGAELKNATEQFKRMVDGVHPQDVYKIIANSGAMFTLVQNDLLKGELSKAAEMPDDIQDQRRCLARALFLRGKAGDAASVNAFERHYADAVNSGRITAFHFNIVPWDVPDKVEVKVREKVDGSVDAKLVRR